MSRELKSKFICFLCNKELSTKQRLITHIEICKTKQPPVEQLIQKKLDIIKDLETRLEYQNQDFTRQLLEQQDLLSKQFNSYELELSLEKSKVDNLKNDLKSVNESHLKSLTKQKEHYQQELFQQKELYHQELTKQKEHHQQEITYLQINHTQELIKQKEFYQQEINSITKEHTKEITSLIKEHQQELLRFQEKRYNELDDVKEISKREIIKSKDEFNLELIKTKNEMMKNMQKPTVVNNNTLTNTTNIQNNFNGQPIDTSQHRFDKIVQEKYDYNNYLKGAEGAKVILLKFLSDDKDNPQAKISDYARNKIKVLDLKTNKVVYLDPNTLQDMCKQSNQLRNKLNQYSLDLISSDPTDESLMLEASKKKFQFYHTGQFKKDIFPKIKSAILRTQHDLSEDEKTIQEIHENDIYTEQEKNLLINDILRSSEEEQRLLIDNILLTSEEEQKQCDE